MKTYQDWEKVANQSEEQRMEFVLSCINEFKGSPEYRWAVDAEAYFNEENPTILKYEKLIYNALGQRVPDLVSANHKIPSKIFYRIVVQQVLVLLGNGISWNEDGTEEALGKNFDRRVVDLAFSAVVQSAGYGYWNLDHLEAFEFLEFIPLIDEFDSSIKAGIRFTQIDITKPLRVTLYELDGVTEYTWVKGKGEVTKEKRAYILNVSENAVDGEEIIGFENYPSFPIVPLYNNKKRTSALTVGMRNKIDAYDLINSGYINDEDDMNILYWSITNAGGMDDADIVSIIDKLRKIHMAQLDGDQQLQAHSVETPYLGREAILDRLEKQIYRDAMALNTYDLASGAVTATQIRAAYEPLQSKEDLFEVKVSDFIDGILSIAGIDDTPTYTRSILVNETEEVQNVISAAPYLSEEYVREKLLTILGDKDRIQEVNEQVEALNIARFASIREQQNMSESE